MPNDAVHRLAVEQALDLVPETCPVLSEWGTKVYTKFIHWMDVRFESALTDNERDELAQRITKLIEDLLGYAKDHGTTPLRDALVREIEDRIRAHAQ